MINLLERVAAFQETEDRILGPRAAELLEWTRVTGQIASLCLNGPAAHAIRTRFPHSSREPISLQHSLADELRTAGDANQWPPTPLEMGDRVRFFPIQKEDIHRWTLSKA